MTKIEQAPVLPLGSGPVVPAAVRTGVQGITGGFLVEGVQLFGLADLTAAQATWLSVALTIVIAAAQNALEHRQGRQLLGRAPAPAVAPPEDE